MRNVNKSRASGPRKEIPIAAADDRKKNPAQKPGRCQSEVNTGSSTVEIKMLPFDFLACLTVIGDMIMAFRIKLRNVLPVF